MHGHFVIRAGKIDSVGDPNNPDESARYKVHIIEEDIVTGWIMQGKRSTLKNQDDWVFDVGESVVCILWDDFRTGVIVCAINTVKAAPATTDANVEQMKFSDGTIVSYDRNQHVYTLDLTQSSGTVIINQGNNGGLVNVIPLTQVVQDIQNDLNEIKGVFAGWTPIPEDGGAELKAAAASWAGAIITPTQRADIEDTKVKH